MKTRNLPFAGIAGAVILRLATPGVAFATPGAGADATVLGRGSAEEKVKTGSGVPYDVVVQRIIIAPGGHTGWHTHPGIAVAVVKSGTLTIYDGDDKSCSAQVYPAEMAYVDPGNGHVHIAYNEGTDATEVYVTYFDVPIGGGVRIDAADPGNCSSSD